MKSTSGREERKKRDGIQEFRGLTWVDEGLKDANKQEGN